MSYEQLADAVIGLVASNTDLKDAATAALARSNEVLDETHAAIGQSGQAVDTAVKRAETARDAVLLSKNIKDTLAAGLASTVTGEYFSIPAPGTGNILQLYKNNAGAGLYIDSYPNTQSVQQPIWAGKKNGWPDTFFREFDLTSQNLLGVDRWWCATGTPSDVQSPLEQGGWSRVKNTIFDGYALRRTANISTNPLNGPVVILSEIDVVEGQTISLYQLFTGSGAVVNGYVRFDDGADRGYVGGQVTMTTDTGATTLTTTAIPQRLKTSLVVPVGAKRLMTYSYTATVNQTYDVVALWAFKGTLAEGPNWPTLFESSINDYKVARVTSRMDVTEPAAAYVVDGYTKVESTSETVTLNGSAFAGFPRDLVFMGWGEAYSPTGVTFNALRVKAISRTPTATAKWKNLQCVVRTGPAPETATGVVVAVGKVSVLEQSDTLIDLTFVLKDPVTGANKTLSDANFTDGKYFIGIWATTAAGFPAACGEPRGILSNSLLQSYYHQSSVNKPQTGLWNASTAGANARLAFQHLNIVSPLELIKYAPSTAFAQALASTAAPVVPEVVTPTYMYGVQGRESNLYFDNLFLCDSDEFLIDTVASGGSQQNERLTWTPAGEQTSGTVTLTVHDKRSGAQLSSTVIQQRAAALAAGTGMNKKCLFVGDSLIAANTITQTMLDIAATDALKVTLLGTLGSGANKHEGRGGWTIAQYVSNGSPFYISGAVNFPQYLTNNSLETPDWVFIHLGINDEFNQTSDDGAKVAAQAAFDNFDILIASIKAAGSSIKIGLMTPTPPSRDQDSFGASYGTGQSRWRFKRNIVVYAREQKLRYTGKETDNIYIVPTNVTLDTTNNMSRAASAPVNSRSTVIVNRQDNGVHPDHPGYRQIGDGTWAFLKYNV